jgi:hypothetical protein
MTELMMSGERERERETDEEGKTGDSCKRHWGLLLLGAPLNIFSFLFFSFYRTISYTTRIILQTKLLECLMIYRLSSSLVL